MDALLIIGRVLYALIFLGSGVAGHFLQPDGTAGYAESRGVSNARTLVLVSGVMLVLAAIGIMLGIWIDLAALLAIIFLLASSVMVHHFWSDDDPMTRQMEMTQFMKNLSMTGAGLIIVALADSMGPMLIDPLF